MDRPEEPRRPVVAVTGAARGIGRGIAFALAEAGFDLVLNDLAPDALEKTRGGVEERGARALCASGDIALAEEAPALADRFFGAFGTIDCLVNNAGVPAMRRGDLLAVTPESFDRTLGVNLRGTFFLSQAVARLMIEERRAASEPPRTMIFISSISAIAASVDRGEYCVSKAGLSMATRLFALRLAEHGVACHEVRPGIVRTPMTAPVAPRYDALIAGGASPMPRWGEPEDVGRAVAALAGGAFRFSTGDAIHVDGGLHVARL